MELGPGGGRGRGLRNAAEGPMLRRPHIQPGHPDAPTHIPAEQVMGTTIKPVSLEQMNNTHASILPQHMMNDSINKCNQRYQIWNSQQSPAVNPYQPDNRQRLYTADPVYLPKNVNSNFDYVGVNRTPHIAASIIPSEPTFIQRTTLPSPAYGQQFDKNVMLERQNYLMTTQLQQNFSNMAVSNHTAQVQRTSNLSADAPVFVPKSFSMQSDVQNSSHHEQVPYDSSKTVGQDDAVTPSLPPHALPQIQFLNHPVILHVDNLIMSLTLKPHKFDYIAQQLTATITRQVKEADLMKEIITMIFEQGIGEANFRYNGARICQHLNSNLTVTFNGRSFKDLLLVRCKEEYDCRAYYLEANLERLCGFALFLADIYTQLRSATMNYIDALLSGVLGVLTTLLSKPSSETLKCVAKVLKGAGYALDYRSSAEMETFMCHLKDVAMTAPIGLDVRALMLNVLELRAAHWGRGKSDPKNNSPPNEHPLGTVFYGPDGKIVKVVSDDNEDSASDTDDSFLGCAPDDEEEYSKEYEEFLQSQVQ